MPDAMRHGIGLEWGHALLSKNIWRFLTGIFRLLALMEHRPLSFAERCGQGVRNVYEKSLNGALFG